MNGTRLLRGQGPSWTVVQSKKKKKKKKTFVSDQHNKKDGNSQI